MSINLKDKARRTKEYVSEHRYEIGMGAVITTVSALYITAVVFAVKDEQERVERHNRWVDKMNERLNENRAVGTNTYKLDDGRYLTVAADGTQQTHIW